ncbi:MAG: hypothetical protein K6G18_15865 [Treponema sp.]|nr:hypothetical protein [Treponema sp.]
MGSSMGSGANKVRWIDMAKFVAMAAVMVDHTNGILYHRGSIAQASYFSVSLFILLMGITSYWSFERNFGKLKRKVLSGIIRIGGAYLLATAVYLITAYRSFDFLTYLTASIQFNASGPFYYVLLYIQLLLAAPVLFYALKLAVYKYSACKIKMIVICAIYGGGTLLVGSLTTRFTNILGIYGGGGKVLGGTYLFLLFVGMVLAENYKSLKGGLPGLMAFTALVACWWRFESCDCFALDARLPFGAGYNPPSVSSITMAFLVAGTVFNLGSVLERFRIGRKAAGAWAWLGRHTLYMFLYHRYFLDFWLGKLPIINGNIWVKRISYMAAMVLGSIAVEYAVGWAKAKFLGCKGLVAEMAEQSNPEH